MSTALHEETTNLFLTAARQKQEDTLDPDIQVKYPPSDWEGFSFPAAGWTGCSLQSLRRFRESRGLFPGRGGRRAHRRAAVEQTGSNSGQQQQVGAGRVRLP